MRRATRVGLVLCAATIAGATALALWLAAALYRPGPVDPVELEITPGEPVQGVLRELVDRRLLGSATAGRLWLLLRADGRSPRYGRYVFPAGTTGAAALERVLAGEVETLQVTVVEGSTSDEIAAAFVAAGLGDRDQWRRLVDDPAPVLDLDPAATSLEGYLFPETYRFAVGVDAATAARHLVAQFRRVWGEVDGAATAPPWGSVHEMVTLASMVEAETAEPAERARIAGVFLNRLRLGMLLQCDPTVVFALRRRGEWTGRLLRTHWTVDDPYNTYRYPGLPPGPIGSPGRASLAAARSPEHHRYIYFVARPEGGHTFSTTLAEHNRAVARLRRSRR